ncbi:ATP-binding protein [Ramlibacter algicola]|uniref:histidine kinase n=1 Tax=Ramlibacter algicola TaxID=2795217 RepID=A0A934USQ0_9BURK|nr:ATP-binding protein [Ramlibacter algicola]MBK0394121.1 response regulator [Ramlibacter algicola]
MKNKNEEGNGESLESIFVGQSDMARLMRERDWASTPLGPPQQWPHALKVALRLLLTSRFEMWLGWGPEIHFFYNDAYRPTLGIKHPRSLGMPTRELWPEIWDDIKGRIESVYERGEATWDRALLLVLHRSGFPEETYHTFSYSPLLGDTGRVEGLFCAVSEETDRVISERRLGTLRDLASGLAAADTRATVVQAACEALGRARLDMPFSLLYLMDETGVARRACAAGIGEDHPLAVATLHPGDGHRWDTQRARSSGEPFVVPLDGVADLPTGGWDKPPRHAYVVPIVGSRSDAPIGLLVAALNPYRAVTEDLLAFVSLVAGQVGASLVNASLLEQHLAERDRLRALFDEAPSFFAVLAGPEHRFELANNSYRQLVGGRDVEGRTVREALPEVVGQGFIDLLDRVYHSGEPYVGRGVEVKLVPAAGGAAETRYVDFVYQPLRDGRHKITGIFVEGYDVTDKIEAEQSLRLLNAHLEQRIENRTRDLAQALDRLQEESRQRESVEEALRHAQKMEAVGQLTGGIAHDFNNMLQGITGSLELIRLKLRAGKVQDADQFVERAMGSAQRAAGMTHRLLAFSRRQPLDPKPVNVNELVAQTEVLVRRTVGEGVRVSVVTDPALWTTLCDPSQLESAILNLAINARDAMPNGGTLVIETSNKQLDAAYARHNDVQPGDYVCVSVSDTGAGMPPDVLAKAFDPFFTTKPIGQGTGLGLSMIYGFVKQSSGHVRLYSEPGVGTSAKLYLPRHRGDAAAPEPLQEVGGEHPATRGEVVLVAEDDEVVRSLVVDVLQGLGCHVLEVGDGAEALKVLESTRRIDLLVTDVGLPSMNGRQVYDAAAVRRPALKVLFMTGYAENAAFTNGVLEEGMELITKPFALEQLSSRVTDMLGG